MKKKYAYLKTAVVHRKKIKDPLQVIAKAFDYGNIIYYRRIVEDLCKAEVSENFSRKKEPGTLLDDFKKLEGLINAAFIFVREKAKSPIEVSHDNLMNRNLYFGRHISATEWDYFPRYLSKDEYCNPYIAFANFFMVQSINEWKKDLKQLLDKAMVNYNGDREIDLLSTYLNLLKLVEAAHLIDVREITHVDGYIKNRFLTRQLPSTL